MCVLNVVHDVRPTLKRYDLMIHHTMIIRIYFSISLLGRETRKLFSFIPKVCLSASRRNEGNKYQKYCHPRQTNVVERYRALEGVAAELRAVRVVLIPINARRVCWCVLAVRNRGSCTGKRNKQN